MTIAALTGVKNSTELKRSLSPSDDTQIIIEWDGFVCIVSKREWNMLTINAHIMSIDAK